MSRVWLLWPHGLQHARPPCSHSLLEFTLTYVDWVGDGIQPSHPLSPPSPPALHLSQHQGLFQWVGSLRQVAKGLEFRLQHQSFQWMCRTDFLKDWLVWSPSSPSDSQELLQHHSSKASILLHSAFFLVQLSHLYTTTGKTVSLTIWTFVSKVMSLLFNMPSRFVIAFLPRSKHFLISWLWSPSSVILEPKERKSVTASTFPPSIYHEMRGPDAISSFFECWVLSQLFYSPLSPRSTGSLVPHHFLPLEWYYLHIWGCWYFSQQSWFQLVIHPAQHFTWCTLLKIISR